MTMTMAMYLASREEARAHARAMGSGWGVAVEGVRGSWAEVGLGDDSDLVARADT